MSVNLQAQAVSEIDHHTPTTSRLRTIMFQDAPFANMSVRRRIVLMSILLTSANLALTLTKSSRVFLFEQARCLLYYQVNDPTRIDPKDGVTETLCKIEGIQYPLSIIVGIDTVLSLLPGKTSCFQTRVFRPALL